MDPTEKALTDKIMKLTTLIQDKYPELIHELEEYNYYTGGETTPQHFTENSEVNVGSLSNYYNSLKDLLKKYIEERDKKDLYILNHL
jgi:hypothetical protein